MANVTAESASATPATWATTATAPQTPRRASPRTDRCAAGGEDASVAAASVQNPAPSETPVRNVPPAPTPVELKGNERLKKKKDSRWIVTPM